MAVAASPALAFTGLCVAISAAFLLSFLSESSPSPGATGAGAQAARAGDPAAQAIPRLAVATFFTVVTFLYVHLLRGGRRIPEKALFVLCGSIALLDLSLFAQPGPLQAQQLGAATAGVLPPAAVATFFLAIALLYSHGHAAGADANQQNPAAVEILEKLTLAAALFTCVLSLFAAALILDTK